MVRSITLFFALATFLCGPGRAQTTSSASGQSGTPDQTAPSTDKDTPKTMSGVPVPVGVETTGVAVDPKAYVIGAEDILYLRVWRENDFTGLLGVRPDGKVTLPLVGDIQAAGLTPERLAAQVTQALSQYINKPDVTVTVAEVKSKKYTITGGVNHPGVFPLVVPTKVFDALGYASGFKEFANKKDIIILRADGKQRLHFNYNEYIKGKKLDQNIFLENGDTIIVKE